MFNKIKKWFTSWLYGFNLTYHLQLWISLLIFALAIIIGGYVAHVEQLKFVNKWGYITPITIALIVFIIYEILLTGFWYWLNKDFLDDKHGFVSANSTNELNNSVSASLPKEYPSNADVLTGSVAISSNYNNSWEEKDFEMTDKDIFKHKTQDTELLNLNEQEENKINEVHLTANDAPKIVKSKHQKASSLVKKKKIAIKKQKKTKLKAKKAPLAKPAIKITKSIHTNASGEQVLIENKETTIKETTIKDINSGQVLGKNKEITDQTITTKKAKVNKKQLNALKQQAKKQQQTQIDGKNPSGTANNQQLPKINPPKVKKANKTNQETNNDTTKKQTSDQVANRLEKQAEKNNLSVANTLMNNGLNDSQIASDDTTDEENN